MKILSILFLMLGTIAANAAEIDFSALLYSVDGQAFKDCAKWSETRPPECLTQIDLTLGRFSAIALNARTPNMTVAQLVERGQLALRLYKGGKQAISVDEIKLIKDALPATQFPPLEIYAAVLLLDPDSLKHK